MSKAPEVEGQMEKNAGEKYRDVTCQISFDGEEGELSVWEEKTEKLCFWLYRMGEKEVELKAQDVGILYEAQKHDDIPEIIIRKITKLTMRALDYLWDLGYEDRLIVTEKATKYEQILGSTDVVQREYSEYLMFLHPDRADIARNCGEGSEILHYEETEDGYLCRNPERSFYARVSRYGEGWFLSEVEVRYDKRRMGIATACVAILAERFLQMYLHVGSYNQPAVGLYEKLGFQVIEELCYYGEK